MTPDALHQTADQQIERMLTAWPSSRPPAGWKDEMRRCMLAAADEPADIRRAVTKLIQTAVGKYAPDIPTVTQTIAQQRLARIEKERDQRRDAEREARRRTAPQSHEPWRGWLALAATHAAMTDRESGFTGPESRFTGGRSPNMSREPHRQGEAPQNAAQQDSVLAPYLVLVADLDYRNHHGCAEYRDSDGHQHPADPNHDATKHAAALHGAEQIWRANGMPNAPTPTVALRKVS